MRLKLSLAAILAGLMAGTALCGQSINQNRSDLVSILKSKLTTQNPHEHDCFGRSLAISDRYIIVGAKGEDTGAKTREPPIFSSGRMATSYRLRS